MSPINLAAQRPTNPQDAWGAGDLSEVGRLPTTLVPRFSTRSASDVLDGETMLFGPVSRRTELLNEDSWGNWALELICMVDFLDVVSRYCASDATVLGNNRGMLPVYLRGSTRIAQRPHPRTNLQQRWCREMPFLWNLDFSPGSLFRRRSGTGRSRCSGLVSSPEHGGEFGLRLGLVWHELLSVEA